MCLEERPWKHVIQQLTIQRIEQEEAMVGGEYLPLSVYERRGFDTKLIEEKCRDIDMHEVLGKTYRVSIKAVYSKTIEAMVRKELFEGRRKMKKNKKRKSNSSSSTSDSSSRSSSSDSSDTKKKKKKNKSKKKGKGKDKDKDIDNNTGKDKGDKDKGKDKDKARDKENSKLARDRVKLATRTLSKIGPLLVRLRERIGDGMVKLVPSWVVESAKKSLAELDGLKKTSESCLKDDGQTSLSWDAAQLEDPMNSTCTNLT